MMFNLAPKIVAVLIYSICTATVVQETTWQGHGYGWGNGFLPQTVDVVGEMCVERVEVFGSMLELDKFLSTTRIKSGVLHVSTKDGIERKSIQQTESVNYGYEIKTMPEVVDPFAVEYSTFAVFSSSRIIDGYFIFSDSITVIDSVISSTE